MSRKAYWVVDINRELRFGPYPNKKEANKARTQVRKISDLGLEFSSNVGVTEQSFDEKAFPVGDFVRDVMQANVKAFPHLYEG